MDEGKEVLPVSVNVSRAHLTNHQFGAHLKALTDQYGIDPGLIELELTESILLDNTEEAVSLIQELKSLGFPIHIDDFGSGYSSLNLLKDLAAMLMF
jgi:EAL domain-containing protein (putative c-di-GMP-specific phosphodiesterase class I)